MMTALDERHTLTDPRKVVDALVLAAEHAVIIADEMANWAYEAVDDRDSASRWRAVAETRRMASDRFALASHKLLDKD